MHGAACAGAPADSSVSGRWTAADERGRAFAMFFTMGASCALEAGDETAAGTSATGWVDSGVSVAEGLDDVDESSGAGESEATGRAVSGLDSCRENILRVAAR